MAASTVKIPEGDLSRAITHERNQDWPDSIEIVARWGGVTRSFPISAAEFFGRGSYGAPIRGEAIISAIDRLRLQRPE